MISKEIRSAFPFHSRPPASLLHHLRRTLFLSSCRLVPISSFSQSLVLASTRPSFLSMKHHVSTHTLAMSRITFADPLLPCLMCLTWYEQTGDASLRGTLRPSRLLEPLWLEVFRRVFAATRAAYEVRCVEAVRAPSVKLCGCPGCEPLSSDVHACTLRVIGRWWRRWKQSTADRGLEQGW